MDKKIFKYSLLESDRVAREFQTSLIKGLSSEEAWARIKKEGANELSGEQVQWWHIMLRQFKSPFIYLLVFAAALSFFLGEIMDGVFVVLFILINSTLGFYQEFKSEQALKLLKQYTKSSVKVLRDGKEVITASSDLAKGDIVFLETGDMIPADMRLIEEKNLTVDETVLTGESISVHKNGLPVDAEPKEIYQAKNLVFTGTVVLEGANKGIVIASGKNTAFGQIKKLMSETAKESVFAKNISKFSAFILKLTIVTLAFVFIANLAIKRGSVNFAELLIFTIALAVSVIPEALPVVTTLSLSRGALKLAKKKVITKRLSAVEDLGSIEIICTDKTGTITENKLQVFEILPLEGRKNVLVYGNLAGAFNKESLEPFDVALKEAAASDDFSKFKEISNCPFDPIRRRNSVLVESGKNKRLLIVRGAPEEIMALCCGLRAGEKKKFEGWIASEGSKGHRSLAVAAKMISNSDEISDISFLENDLQFEGCISFVDPIKKSAFVAVKKAKELGIDIKIITGDSEEVALNVAAEIGLINASKRTIRASDFLSLSENEQKEILPAIAAFARTDPEQKHQLVKLIQNHFEVGFLGEGINDSPALKAAGVSLVVQSASDIAREAADIILLEKDLSVIIEGIEEGRVIFANTIKYLKSTLASNFGNFYAVALSSLFIDFLPMLPIQLLLVNLLSDFPMISIATDTVDKGDTSGPQKYKTKDIVLIATMLGVVSTIFDFMIFGFFYKDSPAVLQTNWFIASILTELVFLFSIRTKLPFYKAVIPSQPIIWLTSGAFLVTITLPFTAIGHQFFHFASPSLSQFSLVIGLVAAYFICSEIVKNFYYRIPNNQH